MADTTTTRDRLISAASELFWTRGFSRTGVTAIIRRSGATSGSFYHFFPTKEALLLAVLERAEGRIPALFTSTESATEPVDRLLAAFAGLRPEVEGRSTTHCFPLALLMPEFNEDHRSIRDKAASVYETWLGGVRNLLAEARGRPVPQDDLHAEARLLFGLIEGAAVQARASGEIAIFDEALHRLRMQLEAPTHEGLGISGAGAQPGAAASPPQRAQDWRSW